MNYSNEVNLSVLLQANSMVGSLYPEFHPLRASGPLYWDAASRCGVVTDYNACTALLRDPHFPTCQDFEKVLEAPEAVLAPFKSSLHIFSQMLVFQERPIHTRLRGLFSRAYMRQSIDAMRPQMMWTARQLLAHVLPQGKMDVMQDFADPFVSRIAIEILGLPQENYTQIVRWARDMENLMIEAPLPLKKIRQRLPELAALITYLQQQIAHRRSKPQEDFFQQLVLAQEEQKMSEAEMLGNLILLLAASIGATAHLIGKGYAILLSHADQLQMLRDNPEMLKAAVEEIIRYDSPIANIARFANEDVEIYNHPIETGTRLTVCLAAANHDPARFSDPDRFDVYREKKPHLAFGYGHHACLGAYFVRTITEIALEYLIRHLHHVETREIKRERSKMVHYLKTFKVTFDPLHN